MGNLRRRGLTTAGTAIVLLLLVLAVVSVVYVTTSQDNATTLDSQSQQISSLEAQLKALNTTVSGVTNSINLPVVNQQPTLRTVWETWYLISSSHQDRFDPAFIVVNQGDTVHMTFIDNDTVAHDFVIGPPYNIIVNATVPGLINDLTGQMFTTPAKNNSPGVVVQGTPGNVSADYEFVAKYSGTFEFVCTYHAQVGMIGYLVVLPNAAYTGGTTSTTTTTTPVAGSAAISIVPGAASDVKSKGYSPDNTTVVLGVNNTVVWTNNDVSPHTVTANDGSFNSGPIDVDGTYSYTFTTPGVYTYHCTYHPWMVGTIVVKASG